jgi:hypothetical protein
MNNFYKLKKKFRILRHWRILLIKSKKYSGFVSIGDAKNKRAIIYDWNECPVDFYIHELLHCALSELLNIDKRKKKELRLAEENLVQDICSAFLQID